MFSLGSFQQNGRLVTTNSIAQGATRENSLDYLSDKGFEIYRASKTLTWPGSANVFISILHIFHGDWVGEVILDGQLVDHISPYLDSDSASFSAFRLASNLRLDFRGSTISGEGFIIGAAERDAMIAADPKCAEVIKPFLTGQDINQDPFQRSNRFAIDLGDRSETEAKAFSACWRHLYDTVRLQRIGNKIPSRERFWWQFIGRQEGLYSAIAEFGRVLGCGQVSKYWCASWLDSGQVFADKVVVFALHQDSDFAILNSCFHTEWAEKTSSRLKGDPNYNLAETFEKFPRPPGSAVLDHIGQRYHSIRQTAMRSRKEGLTSIYNRFHVPHEVSHDIATLRAVHVEMEHAVAAAYGWTDLELGHGFHTTKQGIRYTISEAARRTVIDRLLALNHERYEAEQTELAAAPRPKARARKRAPEQDGLF